uniref:(northern house mosquito) hypothetical protein n=1 Tax=Culex pipiens TaxID=7175 RepID=A0A8D8CXD5_CULPI
MARASRSGAPSWTRSWRTCRRWPPGARTPCSTTLPTCSLCGRPTSSRAGSPTRRTTSSRRSSAVICPRFRRCLPSRRHSMPVSPRLSRKESTTSRPSRIS